MNWLDVIIILGLAIGGIKGFISGLAKQALQIGGIVLAIIAAYRFTPLLSEWLSTNYGWKEEIVHPIFFAGITVAISALSFLFVPVFSRIMSKNPITDKLNRGGGFLFGVVWAALIWTVLLIVLYQLPWQEMHEGIDDSVIACWLLEAVPGIHQASSRILTP
jgi:uncharacterized membrane protein required for colicin V production